MSHMSPTRGRIRDGLRTIMTEQTPNCCRSSDLIRGLSGMSNHNLACTVRLPVVQCLVKPPQGLPARNNDLGR